jgi:hypothetical protein
MAAGSQRTQRVWQAELWVFQPCRSSDRAATSATLRRSADDHRPSFGQPRSSRARGSIGTSSTAPGARAASCCGRYPVRRCSSGMRRGLRQQARTRPVARSAMSWRNMPGRPLWWIKDRQAVTRATCQGGMTTFRDRWRPAAQTLRAPTGPA